ncbi:hypothetical protein Clacol_008318 [Clathrus columnatus]|uniref:Uncharacterized protein n=1 Tax=Clathrus columnatus TaxID=1419009 RepID=A0AAV5ANT1_9AGAM|nr:hypothetical protein Clacol_008318 [Clathrus columnatus]
MESLSMKTLANSLPNSGGNATSEKQLMDNFKAAALSITTLYRSSLDASKQAYSSGYVACLKDILQFVQTGVCTYDTVNSGEQGEHGMMTIGRVMDWVEARLEAIKSTKEEEEEERLNQESGFASNAAQRTKDEKEKDKDKDARRKAQNITQHAQAPASSSSFSLPNSSKLRKGVNNKDGVDAPSSTHAQSSSSPRLSHSVSPAPPTLPSQLQIRTAVTSPSPPPSGTGPRASARFKRPGISPTLSTTAIPYTNDSSQSPTGIIPPSSFTFASDVVTAFPPTTAGTKRRHAMIAAAALANSVGIDIDNGNSSSNSSNSSPAHLLSARTTRKRGHGRGKNNDTNNSNALQLQTNLEMMDVEEDGRERKRVTRR